MAEVVLIIGPCGAGKTTYARAQFPDYLHVDYERLIQSLFATPKRFRFYPQVRSGGALLFECAAAHFIAKRMNVCLTLGGATRRQRAKYVEMARGSGLHVRCIRLLVRAETAIARAKSDPLRPVSSRPSWRGIVEHWFRDFEPVDATAEHIDVYLEVPNE